MVPAADVFVFLFGLSMDREVFILSRMRDEYDRLRGPGGRDAASLSGRGDTFMR
jgi:RND superfamily putative drug exporter